MLGVDEAHFMVDIETLGTGVGSTILSIGAVEFSMSGVMRFREFYVVANRETCQRAGLTEDQKTVGWWSLQSDDARAVLVAAGTDGSKPIGVALQMFREYLNTTAAGRRIVVWGNGAAFDNALIHEAASRCGLGKMWDFWNDRCYRTLKNLRPDIKLERIGTVHDALDDARSQAAHAVKIIAALTPRHFTSSRGDE